jgi:hypothetical protein
MATDPNSDPSTTGFDPFAEPFRLLGVGPSTTDSEIDIAYDSARQKQAASEAALKAAYAAIKDPALRLQAELAYPLDCSSDHLDFFYSGTATSIDDVFEVVDRFPPLTKTNFLARSAIRLGASDKLLMAMVDGHTAIDAVEIYQLLQKLRHEAGRPAPSLINVRNSLDDLLIAHCNVIIAHVDSTEALVGLVLSFKDSIQMTRERARLEVFFSFLNTSRASIDQALALAQSKIKIACDGLRNWADDKHQIERLAEECRAWASLSEAARQLEFARQTPNENHDVVWEYLRGLLHFLVQAHHFEPARRAMDAVIEALHPFAKQHAKAVSLARPFQQQIDWYRDESDHFENGHVKEEATERGSKRYGLIAALVIVSVLLLLSSSIVFWHFPETPSIAVVESKEIPMATTEPESLPAASRGQRYSREYVRYCLFQEERLRIVKQHVQSREDIRAYNALATDWNSRCADYFYQDEDLNAVKDEVVAKQQLLEADARRILSTWPWHTLTGAVPAK